MAINGSLVYQEGRYTQILEDVLNLSVFLFTKFISVLCQLYLEFDFKILDMLLTLNKVIIGRLTGILKSKKRIFAKFVIFHLNFTLHNIAKLYLYH